MYVGAYIIVLVHQDDLVSGVEGRGRSIENNGVNDSIALGAGHVDVSKFENFRLQQETKILSHILQNTPGGRCMVRYIILCSHYHFTFRSRKVIERRNIKSIISSLPVRV